MADPKVLPSLQAGPILVPEVHKFVRSPTNPRCLTRDDFNLSITHILYMREAAVDGRYIYGEGASVSDEGVD